MRHATWMFALAAMLLAGCGSGGSDEPQPPPGKLDAGPAAGKFVAARTYRSRAAAGDGSVSSVQLQLGNIARAADANLPDAFDGLPAACHVNAQRDAVVPVVLTARNATQGFATTISTGLALTRAPAGAGNAAVSAYVAGAFDNGPMCVGANAAGVVNAPSVFDKVQFGQVRTQDYLIVLQGYFSPTWPNGNTQSIVATRAGLAAPPSKAPACLQGPGSSAGTFPLSAEGIADATGQACDPGA